MVSWRDIGWFFVQMRYWHYLKSLSLPRFFTDCSEWRLSSLGFDQRHAPSSQRRMASSTVLLAIATTFFPTTKCDDESKSDEFIFTQTGRPQQAYPLSSESRDDRRWSSHAPKRSRAASQSSLMLMRIRWTWPPDRARTLQHRFILFQFKKGAT
jgi:hypothetical protein